MTFNKWAIASLGALTLTGATLTLTMKSNAQGGDLQGPPPPGQGGPGAGPRFPGGGQGQGQGGFGPGQPGQGGGQFRPNFGGGGGGGTAMDSDNMYLYVLQGNMIFKVTKTDLK